TPAPHLPKSGPILTYHPLVVPPIGYLIPLAALVLFSCAWRFRGRRSGLLRIGSCICLVALIAALSILWVRSNRQVDELMFAAGSSHHELASYSGGIQYQVL